VCDLVAVGAQGLSACSTTTGRSPRRTETPLPDEDLDLILEALPGHADLRGDAIERRLGVRPWAGLAGPEALSRSSEVNRRIGTRDVV